MRTTILAIASTVLLAGCQPAGDPTPTEAATKAVAETPEVEAFRRDFSDDSRFVYASGHEYVLDRRTGCVYHEYHEWTAMNGSDGKPDCHYRPATR